MICNVLGVQLSDLVIYIYIYILIYIYIHFQILFHYSLLQDVEYSSLCYTLGPCCLSILFYIYSMYLLIPNVCESVSFFKNNIPHISDIIWYFSLSRQFPFSLTQHSQMRFTHLDSLQWMVCILFYEDTTSMHAHRYVGDFQMTT